VVPGAGGHGRREDPPGRTEKETRPGAAGREK